MISSGLVTVIVDVIDSPKMAPKDTGEIHVCVEIERDRGAGRPGLRTYFCSATSASRLMVTLEALRDGDCQSTRVRPRAHGGLAIERQLFIAPAN